MRFGLLIEFIGLLIFFISCLLLLIQIIDYYTGLLRKRDLYLCSIHGYRKKSHCFSSTFMNLLAGSGVQHNFNHIKRWTRIRIYLNMTNYFPLNGCNTHWCLAAVYTHLKLICYYYSTSAVCGRGYCNWIKWW